MSSTGSDRYAANCILPRQRITTVSNSDIIRILDQHYSLTLNDTPFVDERVIEQHMEAGISLCDAVNCILPRQRITTVSNSDIILINAVPVRSAMTG